MTGCTNDKKPDIGHNLGKGAVIIVLLFAVVCLARFIPDSSYELDREAVDGVYEATVSPQVQEQVRELARRREASLNSSVEIQINGEPRADQTSGRCNLMAGNPDSNSQDLRIRVTLDADGQLLYESRVLKPGEREVYVILSQIPEPGEHLATAEFTVLDPETGEPVGAVDAGLLLTVR